MEHERGTTEHGKQVFRIPAIPSGSPMAAPQQVAKKLVIQADSNPARHRQLSNDLEV